MAEPFDTYATNLIVGLGLEATPERVATVSAILAQLKPSVLVQLDQSMTLLARFDGWLWTDGPPSNVLGAPGAMAVDLGELKIYGPKDADSGWGSGRPMLGASAYDIWVGLPGNEDGSVEDFLTFLRGERGFSGTIEDFTVQTGAPGSQALITVGGTPSARIFDLTVPRGNTGLTPNLTVGTVLTGAPGSNAVVTITGTAADPILNVTVPEGDQGGQGNTGPAPNTSADVVLLAADEDAYVTRTGTDAAPHFVFHVPRPADGVNGREVELNVGATHFQWRYVGDAVWIDLAPKADFQIKGDKGDGLRVDVRGANLAARTAYDNEAADFTFLDEEEGLLYWRETATPGVWSQGTAFGTTLNEILEALSNLSTSNGVLVQTGPASFAKRAIGVDTGASIPDRDTGDTRWFRITSNLPLGQVIGLSAALDDKANAAAVLLALGGKQDSSAILAGLALAEGVGSNKILYATGGDSFAATEFTVFARDILALANAGAGRALFQLAALSTRDTVATAHIDDQAVTLAKIQNLTAGRLLGRITTDGVTQALTVAQVKELLGYAIADIFGLPDALAAIPAKASAAEIRAGANDAKFATAKGILDSVAWVAVAASGVFNLNLASGINFDITLNANSTFGVPTGMTPGMSGFIIYRQPAVGGKTLARNTAVKVKGGTMFTVSTGNNAFDIGSYVVLPDGTMSLSDIDKDVKS